ncbi:thermostable hemolysin [Marinobacterium sp. D7]|uniref:thermostable hemolysin n=1 Tax=Marinobacterium ramblicola TaxID=2849041 RepID=UPI001C2D5A2C|nr:thermostable hemolysin [Marinobacterium ramblicola]MBV1787992.1 thermostable hemolysin [Marinobacterium ramblicola]
MRFTGNTALWQEQDTGFKLLASDSPSAEPVKARIRQTYRQVYGAELHHFMPLLLWLHGTETAVGLSPGSSGAMFLEHYLDQSVEQALQQAVGSDVSRSGVIELGNFAAGNVGETRLLIPMLAKLLYRLGYEWVVFTSTPTLKNSFRRLGVELVTLASADPSRVPNAGCWGSYYDCAPQVLAGSIAQAMPGLAQLEARRVVRSRARGLAIARRTMQGAEHVGTA